MSDRGNDLIRSLFPKAEVVNEPEVLSFMTSLPQAFSEPAKLLSLDNVHVDEHVLENRIMLAPFIRKFHSAADTFYDNVQNHRGLLTDYATKLFVSTHQPNLFAYSGVFKKVVLLEALKTTIENCFPEQRIVNLFVIIDHDFIDEIWMRRAQLPSFHHSSGLFQLRYPIHHSNKWQMVCNVPKPGETNLYNWKREVISWIKKSSSSLSQRKRMIDNLDRFWKEVQIAYSKARSYSDFNSFLMSRVVNSMWGYSTLFVRLSEISEVFRNGYNFLISNLSSYTETLIRTEQIFLSHGVNTAVSSTSYKKAPLWLHCNCGSKAPVSLAVESKLVFKGSCMSCKRELILDLADPHDPDISKVVSYISPRAIAIPLLLSRDLGISCYCSGKGGLGYLMYASVISKHLGIRWPLTLVWSSKDIYRGIAQNQALDAIHMEIPEAERRLQELHSRNDEYLRKIRELVIKRAELAKANSSLHGILQELFRLKEEQRRIRREIEIIEKAIKIFNLSPCILDYAVNFGMVDTEKQWRRHLLENGNLASHVYFDQNSRNEEEDRVPN